MSNKVNISDIIRDHLRTLRNESANRVSAIDYVTFFGLPVFFAILSWAYGFKISGESIPTLITALSIFAGLLINVLVLIYTVSQNVETLTSKRGKEDVENEKKFLREIFANISYSVLICLVSVVLLLILIWLPSNLSVTFSATIVALTLHFVLTLMMAVKRIHILLNLRFAAN